MRRAWIGVVVVGIVFGGIARAQEKSSALDEVKALHLASRDGEVPVYYSACCKERAMAVQSALAGALRFYQEKMGIRVSIAAAVLDRKDWERAEANTAQERRTLYGMTHFAGPPFVAFVPADDAGVITQNLLSDRGHETPETRALLQSAHLDFDQAASKFILHPALHELGHQLLLAYGIHPPDEPSAAWLYELIASYFAYAYERAELPETATIVEAVTKMSPGHLKYTAVEDYPKTFALMTTGDSANFIWYQHQFEARLVEVYAHEGLDFLVKVKTAFPAGTNDELSPTATIDQLDRAVGGFKAWAARTDLDEFNERFTEAIRHMDNAATMALWADDGVSLLPEMEPIRGRAEIEKFMNDVTSRLTGWKVLAHDNEWHDMRVSGDWASEWAETRQQVQPPEGKPAFTIYGKMLLVLHREKDGWKIEEESWTSAGKK